MAKPICVFDFETAPDEDRMHLFGLPELQQYMETPAGELPNPSDFLAKSLDDMGDFNIRPSQKWCEEVRRLELAAGKKARKGALSVIDRLSDIESVYKREHDERIKLLSTTPEFCRIVAIGWGLEGEEPQSMVLGEELCGQLIDERDILDKFWELAARYTLCGYHVTGFDVPVAFARSAILRVRPSCRLELTPWKLGAVVDLYQARFPKGNMSKDRPGKLKELAPLYGLVNEAEGVEGSHVYELLKQGKIDEIGKYVRSDVSLCLQLLKVFRGLFV